MSSLQEWIEKIHSQHRLEIDLSLSRVREVAKCLCISPFNCPVVTVGGTNGKGSTVAGLEKIWAMAGFKVGAFTSPWLYRFNELVRLQGVPVADEAFIQAFEQIEGARGEITLTQFEFNTLAAFLIFQAAGCEVVILEVGLGGRLDAVNIIDANVAVITSIALDHMDRLGDTREKIGYEKAGIFRLERPIVCGDPNPPETIRAAAEKLSAPFYCQGQDFGFEKNKDNWTFWSAEHSMTHLPLPPLLLQNMATVLMTIELLQPQLPVQRETLNEAFKNISLPGRIEVHHGTVTRILDVCHNPAAAEILADYLKKNPVSGKTRAIFSMLADKDIVSTLHVMKENIVEWYIAPLDVARGASLAQLKEKFCVAQIAENRVHDFPTLKAAKDFAEKQSQRGDRLVIFGSFYTVSAVSAEPELC
ncbi:MAG: bifunctional tetrahydrofolate synthase/dihydrofolate synthase [Gammaproteobacteria bacterium]|nr:bifunctional tetrahydrofolate synthase/dihydrofolate synthase [Gammaproteobacteria bacterium]